MPSILARDAAIGQVYVTRGGLCTTPDGKERVWGFDRVRVIAKKQLYKKLDTIYTIVEAVWNPSLDLPPDYPLYVTSELKIKANGVFKISNRDKTKTIELTFDEAITRGHETMEDSDSTVMVTPTDLPQNALISMIIEKLGSTEGASLRDLAMILNIPYQKVRYLVLKLPEIGYKLIKEDSVYKIEKR